MTRRDITEGMFVLIRNSAGYTRAAVVERVTLPFLIVQGYRSKHESLLTMRVDLDNVRIWAAKRADLTSEERVAFAAEATT